MVGMYRFQAQTSILLQQTNKEITVVDTETSNANRTQSLVDTRITRSIIAITWCGKNKRRKETRSCSSRVVFNMYVSLLPSTHHSLTHKQTKNNRCKHETVSCRTSKETREQKIQGRTWDCWLRRSRVHFSDTSEQKGQVWVLLRNHVCQTSSTLACSGKSISCIHGKSTWWSGRWG